MGLAENGTREIDSGEMEKLGNSEILTHQINCEPLAPGNHELSPEVMVIEGVEQEKDSGAQNIEKKLVSVQETSTRVQEMGPTPGETFQNFGVEKGLPKLEHLNTSSVLGSTERPPDNGSTIVGNIGTLTDSGPAHLGFGILEDIKKSAATDPDQLASEDKGSTAKSKKGKDKFTPVTSSRVLRAKSQEKPKVRETDDIVKEGSVNEEKIKKIKKKQAKKGPVSEFSRNRTHLRYLLHRIKYEQSLIDAYSTEGWKGQSVEKLKPEKELQRAKSHILSCKIRIRNLFQHLDMSLTVGKLPESLFDSVGEIDSEDIFCAKCGSKDLTLDNDIILCDGVCERGYHQFCLEPPLLKAEIPPDDEGWLCPGCDCKDDCLDMLKDFQGTTLSINDSWEKIFPEAVTVGNKMNGGSGSSDDSEDDDYDPDQPETVEKVQEDESSSDESNYFSASDDIAAAPDGEKNHGLPSDDSDDNDFDPAVPNQDKNVSSGSSSSDFTSDSEDLGALLDDADMPGNDSRHMPPTSKGKWPFTGFIAENPEVGKMKGQSLKAELAYLQITSDAPMSSKRHVERLDYKKLLEETYGNSSSDSSDEDFDDNTASKRRKTNDKTILVSPNETPIVKSKTDTKGTIKKPFDEGTNESPVDALSSSSGSKRSSHKRLGEAVTQRLYESFNENQYPTKTVKESLGKELELSIQQVSKWFENARWSYNHRPQMESNTPEKVQKPQLPIFTDDTLSDQVTDLNGSNAIPAQSCTTGNGMNVKRLVNDTGGNSGTRKAIKRTDRDQGPRAQGGAQASQLASNSSNRRQTRSSKTTSNS